MGLLSAPDLTSPPLRVRPSSEASCDHRTLAPRLGLADRRGGWTPLGLDLLERLMRGLAQAEPTLWPAPTTMSGYGLGAGPGTQLVATLPRSRALEVAQAWTVSLGLTPDRTVTGSASLDESTTVFGLDRLGRALPLAVLRDTPGAAAPSVGGERPVRLHSHPLQGLLALLLEAGPLPLWLAPEQVRVLPVTADQHRAAAGLTAELSRVGLRVGRVRHDAPLKSRIARAERARIPCVVVLGAREVARETVAVRRNGAIHEESRWGFLASVFPGVGTTDPWITSGSRGPMPSTTRFEANRGAAERPPAFQEE